MTINKQSDKIWHDKGFHAVLLIKTADVYDSIISLIKGFSGLLVNRFCKPSRFLLNSVVGDLSG